MLVLTMGKSYTPQPITVSWQDQEKPLVLNYLLEQQESKSDGNFMSKYEKNNHTTPKHNHKMFWIGDVSQR